ncbi:hypothetical protein MLD38_039419 [Melastoma candidum]|uniref:Uncharacterized protein n=1 Tax=Melastoma candidum TaxID=119954 RepID=A0ACB9L3H9_9MYRT|nr:hypothetical protein MLD38_039419 [Melastoma candidum]
MERLQAEVRPVPVADNGLINDKDTDNMPFLKAVLKEALRLHPPIPLLVPHRATKDVNINGYDIDAGTMVITNAWTIGRDPAIWEDPEEFRPERFLGSSVDYMGQDFELIPFGAGRRGCPGIMFAMASNEVVISNLVRSFNWEMPRGMRAEDIDMSECTGLTIHRKVHLRAVPVPLSADSN